MSLGVRLLWRAQARALAASGRLSLIPRDHGIGPANPRWLPGRVRHASTEGPGGADIATEASGVTDAATEIENAPETAKESVAFRRVLSRPETRPKEDSIKIPTIRRTRLKQMTKQRVELGANRALVKPAAWYPDKWETERAARKRRVSLDRQVMWTRAREIEEKSELNWLAVLKFLGRLTPKFGAIFDFKVVVGPGAAGEVRARLPTSLLDPSQLERRTQAIIRQDDTAPEDDDGSLRLVITGSEHSVREALLELLTDLGEIKAVRFMDGNSEGMFRDLQQEDKNRLGSVRLLSRDETEPNDKVLTLLRQEYAFERSQQAEPKKRYYDLHQRADEIPRPSVWTTSSLEEYVRKLVYGVVPLNRARALYKRGPSHQDTVVSCLVDIFNSRQLRKFLSPEIVALALEYVEDKGSTFRPAARHIFNQAEVSRVQLDTRILNKLILGSVRVGDLGGFDAVLKIMARKNYYPNSETWIMFLHLVEGLDAKHMVIRRMQSKGLHRIQSVLLKTGRHMVPYALEHSLQKKESIGGSIGDFVQQQTLLYGSGWLDITTLNRMLDILGRNSRLDLCKGLLDVVYETGQTRADVISLNTLITHTRSVGDLIATIRQLQTRWRYIVPDEATYDLLFSIAWQKRSPNMLRVIWHYACFAGLASGKMQARLNALVCREAEHNRKLLLKQWQFAILGREAPGQGHVPRAFASKVAVHHATTALAQEPLLPFSAMLREAYDLDRTVHERTREGTDMTAAVRDSLTVVIPLKPCGPAEVPLPAAPVEKLDEHASP